MINLATKIDLQLLPVFLDAFGEVDRLCPLGLKSACVSVEFEGSTPNVAHTLIHVSLAEGLAEIDCRTGEELQAQIENLANTTVADLLRNRIDTLRAELQMLEAQL
jgi:hypothetical protein